MNEADWIIIAVLLLSTLVGVSRGVVREILAIVGWGLALYFSLNFAPQVAEVLPFPSLALVLRTAIAAILIIVVTLFVCGMLGKICGRLMAAASITFEDRSIGAVFGLARGIVVVCVCVFVLGMTSTVKTGLWRNSVMIVPAERIIDFTVPYLPATIVDLRKNFRVN